MKYSEWASGHYGFIERLGCRIVSAGGGVKNGGTDNEKKCAYESYEVKSIGNNLLDKLEEHAKRKRADGLSFDKISHMDFNDGTTLIRIDYKQSLSAS